MKKKDIIFAIAIYTIFPLSNVFMKIASNTEHFMIKMIWFCLSIGVLGIFSLLWQKLLKNVDLVKAYIFKSTTIIWSVLYGMMLFHEQITLNMLLGMFITTVGVIITILGGKHDAE